MLGGREVRYRLESNEEFYIPGQRVVGGGKYPAAGEHSDHQQLVAASSAKFDLQVGAIKGAVGTLLILVTLRDASDGTATSIASSAVGP